MRWWWLLPLSGCGASGLNFVGSTGENDGLRVCSGEVDGPEGAFAWPGAPVLGEREACEAVLHATGGAAGSRLRAVVSGWGDGTVRIEQRDWNGTVLAEVPGVSDGDLVELDVPFTGEHLLAVVPEGTDAGGSYLLDVDCIEGCDAPWTRSPILLMHGLGVRSEAAGLSYYRDRLLDAGYVARSPNVVPYNDSWARADEWVAHLDAWRADGTWRTVHLVGHSLGGIDARLLAAQYDPEHRIVSVTSLSTPHRGAPVADRVLSLVQDYGWASSAVTGLLHVFVPNDVEAQDVEAQLAQLSLAGMAAFNEEVLDRPDVAYRSWSAVTCNWFAYTCRASWNDETVSLSLMVPYVMMEGMGYDLQDGLVFLDSSLWGEHQGILSADHSDISGDTRSQAFDDDGFILREAGRLAALERGEEGPPELQAVEY